jgi:hypoxanthine phosphoribosyltransferase
MTQQDNSVLHGTMLATPQAVTERIEEIASSVIARYKGKNPLFVCLLRGGAPFASRLMFAIVRQDPYFHPELDYMTIKTYADERTSKPPELVMDLSPSTKAGGRLVVLLDDVLDKGVTADFAERTLLETHAAGAVELIVLIQKKQPRKVYQAATLFGFESPPDWLTGMGLDDARIAREANRWAGYVAIASE